jgi:hypothetical protein
MDSRAWIQWQKEKKKKKSLPMLGIIQTVTILTELLGMTQKNHKKIYSQEQPVLHQKFQPHTSKI